MLSVAVVCLFLLLLFYKFSHTQLPKPMDTCTFPSHLLPRKRGANIKVKPADTRGERRWDARIGWERIREERGMMYTRSDERQRANMIGDVPR